MLPKGKSAILITGAGSGLGAEFLRYYEIHSDVSIVAVDVQPVKLAVGSRAQTHVVDVTSEQEVASLAAALEGLPIGLLLHCAGVRGLVQAITREYAGNVAAAETLQVMTKNTMMKTLEINSVGTFNVIRASLPNLRLAAGQPKCIVLGSRMGSVSANVDGGGYAYRASKAALNAIVKSFSIDVSDVTFAILHPGRVETGLVGWKEDGAMSAEQSVRDCASVIEKLTIESSGQFFDRLGATIEW
jgi:NAD(P)-dependent dehydrogenase (short-subunit alcohol dehydrogenase family)